MKTIEAIRAANLLRLADEVREKLKDAHGVVREKAVAEAVGISAGYLSQLKHGARCNLGGVAARKIERKAEKPEGWMDTDFDLWPFPDAELLAQVERLNRDQRVEVQGAMRRAIGDLVVQRQVNSGK